MNKTKTIIRFSVIVEKEEYEIETFTGEYRSLMALLCDKIYVESFGECKGMGRCGTCVVKITGLRKAITALQRNEEQTLAKMGVQFTGMRLSCQILADESLANTVVHVIGGESVG